VGEDVNGYRRAIKRVARRREKAKMLTRESWRDANLERPPGMLSSWGGVFADLARRGLACHAGAQQASGVFAHRSHWLPDLDWSPPSRQDANVELCRRYLRAYGPATIKDIAYWRSGRLADVKQWLDVLDAIDVDVERTPMVMLDDSPVGRVRSRWPVRLLHRFDVLLLAHRDKSWLIDPAYRDRVWRPAGHIEPVILVHGKIAGTWLYKRRAKAIDVTLRPFHALTQAQRRAADKEIMRVVDHFNAAIGRVVWAS